MAWRSSGDSNEQLIEQLQDCEQFTSIKVKNAMLAVDRGDFTPISPYSDSPQRIGFGATISAPHMHAAALEHLKDHLIPGANVLDVGSGSGYLTACMAHMVEPSGSVVGIEHIPELVHLGKVNVSKNHKYMLDNETIMFVEGDGRQGYSPKAPYKAIHVGAAAKGIPDALLEQLDIGGRMMIPVELDNGDQVFLQIDRHLNNKITKKKVEDVMYVPLTSKSAQLRMK